MSASPLSWKECDCGESGEVVCVGTLNAEEFSSEVDREVIEFEAASYEPVSLTENRRRLKTS